MRSLIPPVMVKDDLDKPNPGSLPPVDTSWTWKIAGIVIAPLSILMFFWFLLNRLDWVIQNTQIEFERQSAIVGTWVVYGVIILIVSAVVYAFVMWMVSISKRNSLVDTNQHQATIKMLEQASMRLAEMRLEAAKIAAGTVVAPNALNYAPTDSHDSSTSANSTGITAAGNGGSKNSSAYIIPVEALEKV